MTATRLNPEYQEKGSYAIRIGGSTCDYAEIGTNSGWAGQCIRMRVDNRGDEYILAFTSSNIELYKNNTLVWRK